MRPLFVAVASAVLTIGVAGNAVARPMTPAEQQAVEAAVKANLKDPDSARFRHPKIIVKAGEIGAIYCGYVNAKNSYGGYAGETEFAAGFGTEWVKGKPDTFAELVDMGNSNPNSAESRAMRTTCSKFPNLH